MIDVEGSNQPLCNEDGTVWVTFNGEIYNYIELRDRLKRCGHVFRTDGDTEVLVHLWEEYGVGMLDHLVGMFALGLYDTRSNTLFLARDRCGKKPLYYWPGDRMLAFASELQALKQVPDFPFGRIDPISAAQYFRYGYVPSPRTIYEGVFSLPAGHYALVGSGGLRVEEYWRPKVQGTDTQDRMDVVQQRLYEAVKVRMRADVPLGAFLSGGVDSSLIVASMVAQSEEVVRTFTISTGDDASDESNVARAIAAHLGAEHCVIPVKPQLIDVAELLARHYGQPFADYSNVPTYYVSRETRRHVTVALSGDGGDELFAGYRRYANSAWTEALGCFPFGMRFPVATAACMILPRRRDLAGRVKDFLLSASPISRKGENASSLFNGYYRRRIFQSEFMDAARSYRNERVERFSQYFDDAESDHPLERWLEADQRMYLTDDLMVKVDVASMAVSLECRAPFLDHRFVETANSLPLSNKLDHGRTKAMLRDMAMRNLPRDIVELPKRGFTLPLARWLREELREWAECAIFENVECWESYLHPDAVHKLWATHLQQRMDHSLRLWTVIAWVLWYRSDAALRGVEKQKRQHV